MFRVKICGVTTLSDVQMVATAGADAIGLNFYAKSKRHITVEQAQAWSAQWPEAVTRVGVFVNASLNEIRETAERAELDWIQLHGDEPLTLIEELTPLSVIRAIRWGEQTVKNLVSVYHDCGAGALLVDAYRPQDYGGTGHPVNWSQARELVDSMPLPVVLAGGLRPDNVREAVMTVRPAAVDTASGVERQPGAKDAHRSAEFVAAAKSAFDDLN